MTSPSEFQSRSAWTMTILLTGLALINFLDKVVIGMVAVPMTAELHLNPAQYGLIAGGFFWLFSVSTIAVGLLSDRIQTRWMLLAMGAAWAIAQVPQAVTTSALSLLVCRVLLGAAEGPFMPVTVHSLYKWFPDRKRSVPIAIVSQGAGVGLLLAGLLIPHITQKWGWRANFVVLGVVGVVWCVLWLAFGREGNLAAAPADAARVPNGKAVASRPPLRKLLTDPSILCVFLFGFAAYWSLSQTLTWLPTYLEKGLGFNSVSAGRWFAVVVIVQTPVHLGLSWLSQAMLARGASTRVARVKLTCAALVTSAVLYTLPMMLSLAPGQKMLALALGAALPTVCFSIAPALLAERVSESRRGTVLSIHTAIASLGAVFSPTLMGFIVQARGAQFASACETGFATCAVLALVAALCALRWLHPGRAHVAIDPVATPPESTAV